VPLPVPDAPFEIVSHCAVVDEVHEHQPPAVTVIVAVPPLVSNDCEAGEIVNEHTPVSCVAVNTCPAMVIVALRAGPLFADTETLTVPFPLPDPPPVTASHDGSLLTADHEHQLFAVTPMAVVPPPTAKFCEEGVMAKLQFAAL
jgi:hypothetical protein